MWIQAPISAFCATGSGGTPSRNKAEIYFNGDIPWVKSGELKEGVIYETEEHINELALAESNAKRIPSGSILIAMYGATVGKTALLGVDAATNQAVCHIIPNKEVAETKYIWYALRTKVSELLSRRVGGAQPNISQQIIRSTKVPIPPLSEQRRIVEILDQADALRKKRAEADAKAERILPALFYKMFGDPVTNPRGWKTRKLSEVVFVNPNKIDTIPSDEKLVSFIPMADVDERWGTINLKQEKMYSQVRKGYTVFQENDVIFAKITPCMENGKAAIAKDLTNGIGFGSTEFHILRPGPLVIKEWIFGLIRLKYFRNLAKNSFTGTAGQQRVPSNFISNISVPVPNLDLQKKFAVYLNLIYSQLSNRLIVQNKIEVLYKTLLSKAFSGDLTSKWREAHTKELLAEMEEQAKLLDPKD